MLELLETLQARLTSELVPGTFGKVYLGITGQERNALLSDYDLLIMGAAGEDPEAAEHTSSTERRIKHVRFEIYVRDLDPEDAEKRVLRAWDAFEASIWDTDHRIVRDAGGNIVAETIARFFGVEDGYTGGEDFPLWRVRGATVDYSVAETRGGWHPY